MAIGRLTAARIAQALQAKKDVTRDVQCPCGQSMPAKSWTLHRRYCQVPLTTAKQPETA